jgi:hypothetical protein
VYRENRDVGYKKGGLDPKLHEGQKGGHGVYWDNSKWGLNHLVGNRAPSQSLESAGNTEFPKS